MNTEYTENRPKRSPALFIGGLLLIGISAFLMFGLRPNRAAGPDAGDSATTVGSQTAEGASGTASAAGQGADGQQRIVSTEVLKDMLGIEISSLQLAVGGTRIDMRYKVVDSDKAMTLTNQMYNAMLVTADGKTLSLPNTPGGARLRQDSGSQLVAGRTYANLFPNVNNMIKSGDTVTLRIGNLRAEHLVVR